ncbi:cobalt transporter CbiM [Campylobacter fetus]|uniref:cobalt transporter CbiM n=1 Tax=Campylobacter fetus TaxID=196 RepID=UPI0008187C62|nr:cobalt transporter CbiM [Campylobacter fetus]AVK80449.1 cobalamin biosynthesis protein CbiM [Campylobacter fetus subsp. testudinum]EAK0827579.1 cobalt transporter CbiM [Campylobacter fetus]OCR91864.1 cobalamin biosynthesis protein CbiM [Campylobacter fetus subsp. testudinum]OCR97508.1 cobalamin biosynthesis protein CbiM [Campylobacter fetus subsp. testudinum]OCR99138.1 cobalamin biosynthesis protein CbiM [Campylobacter fetus subsp. testudinum]
MHISEGVLKPEIIVPAAVIAGIWVVYLLYKLKFNDIPKIACMSAMFFIASFIHIPIGPTSIHLILSGLVGAFLGFNAILAIFVALLLQALLFGYGGITVLGVNLLMIASPAIFGLYFLRLSFKKFRVLNWFLVGFVPILISSVILSLILALNGNEFLPVATLAFVSNLALMVIEGLISLFGISFIYKVNKDLLK